MATKAKFLKVITKPTVVQKAADSCSAIIAKSNAPQTLKDAATALQTTIGNYNTSFDDFNSEVTTTVTKSSSVNDNLASVKSGYTSLKTLAKGLHNVGMATSADLATISFF